MSYNLELYFGSGMVALGAHVAAAGHASSSPRVCGGHAALTSESWENIK